MTDFFKRVAKVTLLPSGISFDQDFRIVFSIEKNQGQGANAGTVAIYNLGKDSRNEALKNAKFLILDAGYADDPSSPANIATMEVMRAQVEYSTPDIVTTFECIDGGDLFRNFYVSESFAAGYTVGDALTRIANKADRPLLYEGDVNVGAAYRNGTSFAGRIGTVLDQLVGRINCTWRFQDGSIVVAAAGQPQQVDVPKLSAATGLIRTPSPIEDLRTDVVWEAEALLNHRIRPKGLVDIESTVVTGRFTVYRCTHSGDTRGNQWSTTMELRI